MVFHLHFSAGIPCFPSTYVRIFTLHGVENQNYGGFSLYDAGGNDRRFDTQEDMPRAISVPDPITEPRRSPPRPPSRPPSSVFPKHRKTTFRFQVSGFRFQVSVSGFRLHPFLPSPVPGTSTFLKRCTINKKYKKVLPDRKKPEKCKKNNKYKSYERQNDD